MQPSAEVLEIEPVVRALDAAVRVPGSKSVTNRALVLAALADGVTTLRGAAVCDDSDRLVEALRCVGFSTKTAPGSSGTQDVTVSGAGGRIPASAAALDAGSAGTAARFLTALASLGHGRYVVDGSARMRERPMRDLLTALVQLGARISSHGGHLPITIDGDGLEGGTACVSGDVSSQFLSALLMVAPYARTPVDLHVDGTLLSRPYIDLTLAMMREFGIEVARERENRFHVPHGCYLPPGKAQGHHDEAAASGTALASPSGRSPGAPPPADYAVEPDASAASYMFAAAAIVGGRVRVEGITRRCKQGDAGFLEILELVGCEVSEGQDWTEVSADRELRGVSVDLRDMPDVAQTLAVIAPFASSPTVIRGLASARMKECDRVAATCAELSRLGVSVIEHADGMTISPCRAWRRIRHSAPSGVPAGPFSADPVRTYDDHRMAMAFALVGLRVPGIRIENPRCVAKTFPRYFETLETLRGGRA